jgi:hypothetical protein
VLADLHPNGHPATRPDNPAGPLDRQLQHWSETRELTDVDPTLALRAITTWSRLHGMISLEIEGNFTSMGLDPQLLYDTEVTAILDM